MAGRDIDINTSGDEFEYESTRASTADSDKEAVVDVRTRVDDAFAVQRVHHAQVMRDYRLTEPFQIRKRGSVYMAEHASQNVVDSIAAQILKYTNYYF